MKQNSAKTDDDLVRSYLSGDDNALKLLVEKWHVRFCNKAFWILKDADLAKDVAQDTWQIIIQKMPYLNAPNKFGSWALRIVSNKSMDVLNYKNKERLNLESYQRQQMQGETQSESSDINAQLLLTIKALPKKQQEVLELFYVQAYSLKHIAEMLTISVGTAKSRLFHAREKLKSILKEKRK